MAWNLIWRFGKATFNLILSIKILWYVYVRNPVYMHVVYCNICTYVCMYFAPGIAVLRKYYKSLIGFLPDDHFVTLSAVSNTMQIKDPFFDEVLNYTDSKRANRKILDFMITLLSNDKNMNGFCNVLREVIGSKSLTLEFLEFQIGNVAQCTYHNYVRNYNSFEGKNLQFSAYALSFVYILRFVLAVRKGSCVYCIVFLKSVKFVGKTLWIMYSM